MTSRVDLREEPAPGGPTAATTTTGISVVVPVSERPHRLDELYWEFAPAVRSLGEPFEFLFVLPPWARDLEPPIRTLRERGEPVRILRVGHGAGESAMLRAVIDEVRSNIVVTLPPYHRVTPESLLTLVARVRDGADMATARRRMADAPALNRLQRRAFHLLLRWSVGAGFQDIASGVRAARREVLEQSPLYGDFFRFLPLLAQTEGFEVVEVEVPSHPGDRFRRVYSPGIYVRRLLDLLALVFLVRFTHKPLRFLGLIGAFFAVPGTLILLVLFFQRLAGQPLADRPLLLLGVLLFSLGVQTISIGLVGEIIVHFGASRRLLYRVRGSDGGVGPPVE